MYQEELIRCYDEQAKHFGKTREKHWPECDLLTKSIAMFTPSHEIKKQTPIRLIELGSGTGRLYPLFLKQWGRYLDYTGVDFAPGMITQAKTLHPSATWEVADMNEYIAAQPQESVDMVVAFASIQHLTQQSRELLFAQLYKALRYGGQVIMTNWSYSRWFLEKYWRQQLYSLGRSVITAGRHSRNDLFIPWKDPQYEENQKIYQRYYHLFTRYELEQLARLHGFIVRESGYVQHDGSIDASKRQSSRNTWFVIEKHIE